MKVVCFVPSWTETLVWAGVDVVGRTRFCIHPSDRVKNISTIGGTKDVDWKKVDALKPDLVLFDREENTLPMVEGCRWPWHATHVRSVQDMPSELRELAKKLHTPKLNELALRWEKMISTRFVLGEIPALIRWHRETQGSTSSSIFYVIWANPWMQATRSTFIGSVCELLGWRIEKANGPALYPEFQPQDFPDALYLCSSEPFPFEKRPELMDQLPGAVALVDGEKLSWFGLRTLTYLESLKSSRT